MRMITGYIVADPSKLPPGTCQRCGGWSPGYGPCHDGVTGIEMHHAGGEVRCAICGRCGGTGKELYWKRIPQWRWYKPQTWGKGWYVDNTGTIQNPRFGQEYYP